MAHRAKMEAKEGKEPHHSPPVPGGGENGKE